MTVYEADWICPATSPPIQNGALIVHNGRIVDVCAEASVESAERVRFPGSAVIPGFVNAHAHLELTVLRGFLENLDFVSWIRKLVATKYEKLTPDELRKSARLGAKECIASGVTCVGEVMDVGTSWSAMREAGLQGVVYQEVFGPGDSQADEAFRGLREKVEGFRREETETCRIGVSPHAPYTVSPRLFQLVSDYARSENLPLTVHIAESAEEDDYVRNGHGPFAKHNRERGFDVRAASCSGIQYLHRFGLLGDRTLLIHAIRSDEADIALLRNTRTAVVHCPKSNAKLAHGVAPVEAMLRSGVTVGLGTDSVASNNVVDMFEEMRCAVFMQRVRTGRIDAMDATSAFQMATIGGARSLGLSAQLGSLEAGKRADFAVVDLSGVSTQPVFDPVETMVYSSCRADVRATYIGGNRV